MLEEIVLIVVGFFNYHIPKDQMQEIVECGQRKEMSVFTVRMENRVSRWWYVILAMAALVGSIIYFFEFLCSDLLWAFGHQRMVIGAVGVALLIILFCIIMTLFLHAPFIGESKAVHEIEERCRVQYGVIIILDE